MKILFVTPEIGRKEHGRYIRTWQMEPLTIASLVALTPDDVEIAYVDERLGENINYETHYDLVAVTVETYTARRAYEITTEFRKRGVKTIVGGYHVTLIPEEAKEFADAICIGNAESVWSKIIGDAKQNSLERVYRGTCEAKDATIIPSRKLFSGRNYFKLSCVESGRGCPFHCEFCSIAAFTESQHSKIPIESVVAHVDSLSNKNVFFTEDNFVGSIAHTKRLLKELIPLNIRWVAQGTLTMARDTELLQLMKESGCLGMLIGFESLDKETLSQMKKQVNIKTGSYGELIRIIHQHEIAIYGTFVFGYDRDNAHTIRDTVSKAIDYNLFMAAFNHLVPFPGTPLYSRLIEEGRIPVEKWWLDPSYRFGDVSFLPKEISPELLREECLEARRKFYSYRSIFKRGASNIVGNCGSLKKTGTYIFLNQLLRREVDERDGLPLGSNVSSPRK